MSLGFLTCRLEKGELVRVKAPAAAPAAALKLLFGAFRMMSTRSRGKDPFRAEEPGGSAWALKNGEGSPGRWNSLGKNLAVGSHEAARDSCNRDGEDQEGRPGRRGWA